MAHPGMTKRESEVKSARDETLRHPLGLEQRLAKGLEQGTVDRVALRIIFSMPLNAECKGRRLGNPDRLDRAVLRKPPPHAPFAGIEDALTVQRVDADRVAAEQLGKSAAGEQPDFVAVG